MTVADLMEDRVALDGVLMKCNQNPAQSRSNSDCINARIAIERLAAKDADPALEEKRQAEFERAREQRRLAHDKQREAEEAKKKKVDAYSLPLVPVEPAPTPAPPQPSGDPPPLAGTTTP